MIEFPAAAVVGFDVEVEVEGLVAAAVAAAALVSVLQVLL